MGLSEHSFLLDESVILGMRSDPEPDDGPFLTRRINSDCTVVNASSDGPELAYLLQVQGWMHRIGLQQFEVLVGRMPYARGKTVVQGPVVGTGVVFQREVHLPA